LFRSNIEINDKVDTSIFKVKFKGLRVEDGNVTKDFATRKRFPVGYKLMFISYVSADS
jgi:hypothetical protein